MSFVGAERQFWSGKWCEGNPTHLTMMTWQCPLPLHVQKSTGLCSWTRTVRQVPSSHTRLAAWRTYLWSHSCRLLTLALELTMSRYLMAMLAQGKILDSLPFMPWLWSNLHFPSWKLCVCLFKLGRSISDCLHHRCFGLEKSHWPSDETRSMYFGITPSKIYMFLSFFHFRSAMCKFPIFDFPSKFMDIIHVSWIRQIYKG